MNARDPSKPVILVFSAHDPSGAAGLQADIESICRHGGHCVSVITAVTAQNTSRFESLIPQSPAAFREQLEVLADDITFDCCKIGLVGSDLLIHEISDFLDNHRDLPVIVDPVLHAGTGTSLDTEDIRNALMKEIIPRTTILTPNLREALMLTRKNNRGQAAGDLVRAGCLNVLVTGADQSTENVINVLYSNDSDPMEYAWERLPGTYHGSGCTLAATIACLITRYDVGTAVYKAQEYTWNALKHGRRLGHDQIHPDRQFPER